MLLFATIFNLDNPKKSTRVGILEILNNNNTFK